MMREKKMNERKAAKFRERRRQLEEIAPLLASMPWRNIRAGRARIGSIDDFLRYYEMYAPLLAGHKEALARARDSGTFDFFDLLASTKMILVEGIDRQGNRQTIIIAPGDYWEEAFSFRPHMNTPW